MVKQASRFSFFFSHNRTVTVVELNVMARTLLELVRHHFYCSFSKNNEREGSDSSSTLLVFSALNNVTFHFAYETCKCYKLCLHNKFIVLEWIYDRRWGTGKEIWRASKTVPLYF